MDRTRQSSTGTRRAKVVRRLGLPRARSGVMRVLVNVVWRRFKHWKEPITGAVERIAGITRFSWTSYVCRQRNEAQARGVPRMRTYGARRPRLLQGNDGTAPSPGG